MTTQEIIEGNKLIAEFMGLTKSINGATIETRYVFDWKNKPQGDLPVDLKFNSSWDWLMPVIEKIETLDFIVIIKQNECVIVNNSGETPKFIQELCETKIKSVCLAVVEFIKWYDENK